MLCVPLPYTYKCDMYLKFLRMRIVIINMVLTHVFVRIDAFDYY